MTPAALKTEIETGPLAAEIAPLYAAGNDIAVAAVLNSRRGENMLRSRLVSARAVLGEYPDGPAAAAAVLDKLEAASATVPAVKWVMSFLRADGIDIGSPATQGMLDQLAAGGAITAQEATKLKSLGIVPASRAELVFGQLVSITEVSETRRV